MNTALARYNELEYELETPARRKKFQEILPKNITVDEFKRCALTAVSLNPKLLEADQRSFFNSLMRLAQKGLRPDGREAVLVIYQTKDGPIVGDQDMVQGIRQLIQQSGEITRFEQTIVYENDKFAYELGDHPHILHVPAIDNRGKAKLLYSIAQFRDGTLSREVMTATEIEHIRTTYSRAKDGAAWKNSWGEMARKTIAKRHAKVLPKSHEAANALALDDAEYSKLPPAPVHASPSENRPRSLADQLDALGTAPDDEPPQPKRGRRRKDDEPTEQEIAQSQARLDALLGDEEPPLTGDEPELQTETPDDGWPGPISHDYEQGKRDAVAGYTDCLNRDIRDIATRYAEWRKGFDSVKKRNQ